VCRLRLADAYVLESASPQVYTLSYTTLFRSRRRLVEADPQLGLLRRKAQEAPLAHQSADAADPQAVALRGAVHLVQVHQPPITQDHAIGGNQVRLFEQQQVHGWTLGGWSPSSDFSSSVSACSFWRRIIAPKNTPTSNSIHIGTASSVCENTSGGVRIMPTRKQPTITYGRLLRRVATS